MTVQSNLGFDIAGTEAERPSVGDDGVSFFNSTKGQLQTFDGSRSQWAGALQLAIATYDFAVNGGAIGDISLTTKIPDNAIIWDSFIDVVTTLTSATDAATVAIKTQAANDIVSAIAISDVGNPWDAGVHAGIPVGTAAAAIKMTAERIVTATVAVEALTAGKFHVGLLYAVTD